MLRSLLKPMSLGGAKLEIIAQNITMSGKHGTISMPIPSFLELMFLPNDFIVIKTLKALTVKSERALAGSFKANLMLNIKGVNELHSKIVIFTGTGSSVKEGMVGQDGVDHAGLHMRLGKSHIVERVIPAGLICKVESSDIRETRLRVSGTDLSLVGRFASQLCVKNAYKGGIHVWVEGKEIPIKEGKSG